MTRFALALKILFLLAFVSYTFMLFVPDSMSGAWTTGSLLLLIGIASLKKSLVLGGEGDNPGWLPVITLILLVGPVILLHVLPYELHEFGISTKVPDNSLFEVVLTLMSGFLMALWVWIPLLAYFLIDFVFKWFQRHEVPEPT